jgi:antitoxin component of MazEF toxin-antitoxin module
MGSNRRQSEEGKSGSDDSSRRSDRRAADRDRRASGETLASLLRQVTPDRRHEEIDWGPPVGKEVW